MIESLARGLAAVTNIWMLPVVVALLVLMAWALFLAGATLAQARVRRARRGLLVTPEVLDIDRERLEFEALRRSAWLSLGARLGPMLGLMGTLIPLGPALIGLSGGDLETLGTRLVLAFGTTVLGLAAGALLQILVVVHRNWDAADLLALEAREEAGAVPSDVERSR